MVQRVRLGLGAFCLVLVVACGGAPAPRPESTVPPGVAPPAVAPGSPAAPGAPGAPAAREPRPPVARKVPHDVVAPAGTRDDPYYWIRDDERKNPEVLDYLRAENAYTAAILAPNAALERTLLAELRSRIKEDDSSVPYLDDGYWYYTRYETDKQQPVHCRRKGDMKAAEEVLLDGNQLAEGHPFYRIGEYAVSRSGRLLAWADDTVGRNQFTLHIKDLSTGKLLPDTASNISPSMAWAADDKTLFYTGKDEITLRPDRVFRHTLGAAAADELIYKEDDSSYYVGIGLTKSKRYIEIVAGATTNTEVRLLDARKPAAPARIFLPRSKDHEYSVDHLDGRFVMLTNAEAKNFRLVSIPEGKQADRKSWKELLPHSPEVFIEGFAVYRDFVAATVRTGGLEKVRVLPKKGAAFYLEAEDPTYAMSAVDLPDAGTRRLRYEYDSMVAPSSVYEVDVATRKRELLKQKPMPGYDPGLYTSEYLHATASDGTSIPISVVYKKTTARDGHAPLLVYGYGSYGASMDASVSSAAVSLLDRGWVYALAHVRGGQEMGRSWYEDGKLMHKKNTFTDFIAVTEYLVAQKYGARDQVYAEGGSAGGLLMGVILNLRPDLYRGAIVEVPFVDAVTTMLDETIPLTSNEFDEWGNPQQPAAYEYILSYSPYDQIKAQAYPSIYVRTSLWDSQVQYYEPAKWVARLRANKTDANLLLLDVDMTSGHGGASGRFDRLAQVARELAFLLLVHDRTDARAGWPAR